MQRSKVLFVLPWLPYPLISGGHQAIFNGIKAVEHDIDIYITYNCTEIDDIAIASFKDKIKDVTVLPYKETIYIQDQPEIPKVQLLYHNIKEFIKRKLFKTQYKIPENIITPEYVDWKNEFMPIKDEYACFVNRIIKEYSIDIVQCEMVRNIPFVWSLPACVKKVFIHHELRYITKEQCLSKCTGTEIGKKSNLGFIKTLEIGALNLFDEVVVLSKVDKIKLCEAGVSVPITVSYPCVSTEQVPSDGVNGWNHVLCFIGTENHSPNVIGLDWFLSQCWDNLLNQIPDIQLRVIGNWGNEIRNRICSKYQNIDFTGFVENLKDVMSDSVMIVPITIGSGIRMKILEAAMLNVPVVTTSIGVEGIPFVSGEHCMIADSPAEFVKCVKIMENSQLYNTLISKAQETVKETFSISSIRNSRIHLYRI